MIKKFAIIITSLFIITGCVKKTDPNIANTENNYANNRELAVKACDLSGKREANVKVDIGFGNRKYYGYTNATAQLVYIDADELSLQTKSELHSGEKRYCTDEAFVKGTEQKDLDQGHVIADSLGGVSNAYNITPQNSFQNRKGVQSQMENLLNSELKAHHQVTNFVAIISYPDKKTTIPNHYHIEVDVNGTHKVYDFENKE